MDKEQLLRLLIIEDSLNDAEVVASLLRNAGYAVRASHAEDEEQLNEVIRQQPLDVVLCSTDSPEPTLAQAHNAIRTSEKDIPLLAVASEYDAELAVEVMRHGALDLVVKSNPTHLQLAVNREMRNLDARRRMRQAEHVFRESEKRCHALLDSSRDAITYVHEGMHIYANPVYLDMFGFDDLEEIEGVPIMDMVAPEDHGKFKDFLRRYSKGEEQTHELEVKGLRPDGSTFNAVMEFSPASIEGEPCTQIIIRDQSMDKELEKKLKYLSKQDLLTGLYNRQYFLEELEQAIAAANTESASNAVLYIEPDNFKAVKESVGIAGCDLILSDIAGLIRDNVADSGTAARFGDHSFAVLLPDMDTEQALTIAENIRSTVESHIADVSGQSVATTCSIGISPVGETAENAHDVVSRADLACDAARKQGGNRAHVHDPASDQEASDERDEEWIRLIRDALDNDRFALAYQPIVSLHGETKEIYEVLLRMHDADGNEVLPGQFIPVAEQNNLMDSVDRWVIEHAIQALAERRRAGSQTMLFVKISGKTVDDEALLPWLNQQLKEARLEGDALAFELSESAAVTNLKNAKTFAKGLHELHCKFCLEHFGRGMNPFQLLKHLPVDFLKIDGSFMHNLASNQENQAMIKSITEMAHSMGKLTIAEVVEDANSLAVLWQSGVNYIQGHFLQKPEPSMVYDFAGEEA